MRYIQSIVREEPTALGGDEEAVQLPFFRSSELKHASKTPQKENTIGDLFIVSCLLSIHAKVADCV